MALAPVPQPYQKGKQTVGTVARHILFEPLARHILFEPLGCQADFLGTRLERDGTLGTVSSFCFFFYSRV